MILIIEILLVIASFVALVATGVSLGRNARRLGKSSQKIQGTAEPKIVKLSEQAETASQLGLRIQNRVEVLQERSMVLSATFSKMMVLINAFLEAKKKLNKVTGYIGL